MDKSGRCIIQRAEGRKKKKKDNRKMPSIKELMRPHKASSHIPIKITTEKADKVIAPVRYMICKNRMPHRRG